MIAIGFPPVQTIFLAASATAIMAPTSGSAFTYLELQSTVRTSALFVPLRFTTPAEDGKLVAIFFVPTMVSYCSYTHRLEAIFGCFTSIFATSIKSWGSGISSILNFLYSL